MALNASLTLSEGYALLHAVIQAWKAASGSTCVQVRKHVCECPHSRLEERAGCGELGNWDTGNDPDSVTLHATTGARGSTGQVLLSCEQRMR